MRCRRQYLDHAYLRALDGGTKRRWDWTINIRPHVSGPQYRNMIKQLVRAGLILLHAPGHIGHQITELGRQAIK